MAYCLFTVAIPLANLVTFVLRYHGMQDTGELLASQAWKSNYLSDYTISHSSVNQPVHPTYESEDDNNPTEEETGTH